MYTYSLVSVSNELSFAYFPYRRRRFVKPFGKISLAKCKILLIFDSRLYYLKYNRGRLSKNRFFFFVNENISHFSFEKKKENKELAEIFVITSIQFSKNPYISNILIFDIYS